MPWLFRWKERNPEEGLEGKDGGKGFVKGPGKNGKALKKVKEKMVAHAAQNVQEKWERP